MRRYSAAMSGVNVSAAKDLVAITAPATMAICITRAWISQSGNNTSEQNQALFSRASTNNSSGASTITPRPMEVGDPASSATVRSLPTSDNTLTGDPMEPEGFNWVTGWLWVPAPEERIWIPPSGIYVLRLNVAPSAAKSVSAGVNFIEVG